MTEQLKRDLTKRINERLHLWVDDSIDLFEMAGLSHRDGLQAVIGQLIYSLAAACMVFDIPPDKLAAFITEAIKRRTK
jgi:hypothetical protein